MPHFNIEYNFHHDHILDREPVELPSVDMFVTTADPVLEPPIITVNTMLSLLAVDYLAHKLACYVSDDGCSPLTYYSLVEASKFAQLWVPFCKMYDIQVRAPFRYFSNDQVITLSNSTKEFQHERKRMKDEYEHLCHKIEVAVQKSVPTCDFTGDFAEFSSVQCNNHPTIIKRSFAFTK
ncbi:cellulose synthase-like protein B3 [Carya illinoinensis]|uniref:cellulose synthase-like protein B3 n=1 Tax=Carya illinoinensis TaxID=32201 RepID=UPI001C71C5ED|nr:cellulose synthase-like protein B3 [Carya illinoinensis]